ncbi:Uncharacterised protein [Citrobacter freundii]|nr:Uncharacterised protein [Citrobacter freundii]
MAFYTGAPLSNNPCQSRASSHYYVRLARLFLKDSTKGQLFRGVKSPALPD